MEGIHGLYQIYSQTHFQGVVFATKNSKIINVLQISALSDRGGYSKRHTLFYTTSYTKIEKNIPFVPGAPPLK